MISVNSSGIPLIHTSQQKLKFVSILLDRELGVNGGQELLNLINLNVMVESNDNLQNAMNHLRDTLPYDELTNAALASWCTEFFEQEFKKKNMRKFSALLCQNEFESKQIDINREILWEWQIDDNILKQWKNARVGQRFYSDTFGVGGNWCMLSAPNGDGKDNTGDFVLAVRLLRLDDGIHYNVVCQYELKMIIDGEEIAFDEPAEFRMDQSFWYWPEQTLSTDKFRNMSTVQIYVKIWDIQTKAIS